MPKFIHSADWQLGMTRHFLAGEAQPRFDAARTDAVRTIGTAAVEHGCEFVVVAGDVFETNFVDRTVVLRALDAMAATPSITFYLLPGNHDPLDASSVFRSRTFVDNRPDNVVVIGSGECIDLGDGVELLGAPWFTKRPLGDLVSDACADLAADGTTRIVVGHGAVDVLSPDRTDPAVISLERLEALIAEGCLHYVALGDRHSTTSVGSTGRIHYAGAPEPTDYREVDPGNVLLVDVGPDHCTVEPIPIGSWRFVDRQWHLNGPSDLDALEAWAASIERRDRCIVKLSFVGQISLTDQARLDDLLEHYRSLFASVETWERHTDLVVMPDDDELADLQLSGFAGVALAELRDRSASDDAVARDALGLLFRLGADRS
ncbi:MAG: exonuclease SbcCD subunit D [Ilumatobacter sp.]|uniref:metallophosphoesterase family protein n=1 Tax=Ilumatobacter sp. TaxID=1967498 RepID=UPI00391DD418